jgi:hypothetical protein
VSLLIAQGEDVGYIADCWHRLLGGPASEVGRLCHADGARGGERPPPEGARVGYALGRQCGRASSSVGGEAEDGTIAVPVRQGALAGNLRVRRAFTLSSCGGARVKESEARPR